MNPYHLTPESRSVLLARAAEIRAELQSRRERRKQTEEAIARQRAKLWLTFATSPAISFADDINRNNAAESAAATARYADAMMTWFDQRFPNGIGE